MLQKSTGIVLHTLKYSDDKNIVTIFTRKFGRMSFVVYRSKRKNSACRSAYLQPLSILSVNTENKANKDLQYLKEVGIDKPFKSIFFHYEKNSIAFFIAELLNKTIRQTGEDTLLYDFLEDSILTLDNCEKGLANFHLVFLIKLSKYLGFEPNIDTKTKDRTYFDLQNGVFVNEKPMHKKFLTADFSQIFFELNKVNYDDMDKLTLGREKRNELLDILIDYYRIHLSDFKEMQSLEVLHELFC